jgi:hypothetical protein
MDSGHYVGSASCQKCHAAIYERWKKTPLANVVRDPREHPDAIIPDLQTNNIAKFSIDQVAFVYGSRWKQRYFTKIGDEYYPLTSLIRAKTGGRTTTLRTICSGPPARPAMVVTR